MVSTKTANCNPILNKHKEGRLQGRLGQVARIHPASCRPRALADPPAQSQRASSRQRAPGRATGLAELAAWPSLTTTLSPVVTSAGCRAGAAGTAGAA